MALDEPVDEDEEKEDIEVEVDLEGELISSLEELSKTIRELKNFKLVAIDEQGLLKQSLDESSQLISNLKLQPEETKRICEVTSSDLKKKEKENQDLEEEIVKLRKELE